MYAGQGREISKVVVLEAKLADIEISQLSEMVGEDPAGLSTCRVQDSLLAYKLSRIPFGALDPLVGNVDVGHVHSRSEIQVISRTPYSKKRQDYNRLRALKSLISKR